MKEEALIDEQILQVQNHGGDINSNLGENLPWKEKLERIVEVSASIHQEFDVALNGMCSVIKKIENYISSMANVRVERRIKSSPAETQYYPNTQAVHVNDVVMNPQVSGVGNVMENAMKGEKFVPHKSAAVKKVRKIAKRVQKKKKQIKKSKHSRDEDDE